MPYSLNYRKEARPAGTIKAMAALKNGEITHDEESNHSNGSSGRDTPMRNVFSCQRLEEMMPQDLRRGHITGESSHDRLNYVRAEQKHDENLANLVESMDLEEAPYVQKLQKLIDSYNGTQILIGPVELEVLLAINACDTGDEREIISILLDNTLGANMPNIQVS